MVFTSPYSTIRPEYITSTSSAMAETTPRSWVMRIMALPSFFWMSESRRRICAWMVTSSAVVGSSAMRMSGSQAMAMAISTRWRMPPENWCG